VLTRSAGGGGVLIDIGSHLLDVILYALPGEPRLVTYMDNSRGGIETDCVTSFSIRLGAMEIPVRMELSRTRELRGSIRIQCERATLELDRPNFTQVRVHPADPTASDSTRSSSPFRVTAEVLLSLLKMEQMDSS
jgi:predicted dehydrogenase